MYASRLLALLTLFLSTMCIDARKVTNSARVPKNAVLLSNVASLTLRSNKLTSSRRVKPIPQLDCVGPDYVCALYKVETMRCKNEGADYDAENIQWSCKASLPEEFKLGSTEVICEGYESSDDPYVLKGSCGVEYRLALTDKGLRKYGSGQSYDYEDLWRTSRSGKSSRFGTAIFFIIFAAVLFIILRGMLRSRRAQPPRRGGGYRPQGGGGDDDPPPPYDDPPAYPRSPPGKRSQPGAGSSGGGNSRTASSQARTQQQGGAWRPGFWTGAFTGAAAGYTANRFMNRPQTQSTPRSTFGSRGPSSSPSGSGASPSYSSERHESTGFGGTRRR